VGYFGLDPKVVGNTVATKIDELEARDPRDI
jgi:hypothetical protein